VHGTLLFYFKYINICYKPWFFFWHSIFLFCKFHILFLTLYNYRVLSCRDGSFSLTHIQQQNKLFSDKYTCCFVFPSSYITFFLFNLCTKKLKKTTIKNSNEQSFFLQCNDNHSDCNKTITKIQYCCCCYGCR
jgi:hypothetical protein